MSPLEGHQYNAVELFCLQIAHPRQLPWVLIITSKTRGNTSGGTVHLDNFKERCFLTAKYVSSVCIGGSLFRDMYSFREERSRASSSLFQSSLLLSRSLESLRFTVLLKLRTQACVSFGGWPSSSLRRSLSYNNTFL